MSGRGRARQALAPVVLLLAAGLVACGDDAEAPATSASSRTEGDSVVVEVTREGDTFTPNGERVDLGTGQTLVLEVSADVGGVLDVHTTPAQEVPYEAGTSRHEVTIDRPGVVEVESHDPTVVLFQLEVR